MLAADYVLIFLFPYQHSPGSTFNVQLFVVNFNFSFSIGLRFRAGHYKISAQQQALLVSGHCNGRTPTNPNSLTIQIQNL
jgi:hypothetical protein